MFLNVFKNSGMHPNNLSYLCPQSPTGKVPCTVSANVETEAEWLINLLSWILNNFITESVSEVWCDNGACVWAVKIPDCRVCGRLKPQGMKPRQWVTGLVVRHTHTYVWAIQGATRPNLARLGPGPSLVADGGSSRSSSGHDHGREEELRQGSDPWWEGSLSIIIRAPPHELCTNI